MISMLISDPSFPDNCIVTYTTFRELLTGFEGQEMLGFHFLRLRNPSSPLSGEDRASMRSVRANNDVPSFYVTIIIGSSRRNVGL